MERVLKRIKSDAQAKIDGRVPTGEQKSTQELVQELAQQQNFLNPDSIQARDTLVKLEKWSREFSPSGSVPAQIADANRALLGWIANFSDAFLCTSWSTPSDIQSAMQTLEDFLQVQVRVYVRLNAMGQTRAEPLQVEADNKISYEGKEFGPFESVFPEDCQNACVFSQTGPSRTPLNVFFYQLLDGYSNILFGYGYSGSGKTYTLFGNSKQPGVVRCGLELLHKCVKAKTEAQKEASVKLAAAFELYGNIWFKGAQPVRTKRKTKEILRIFYGRALLKDLAEAHGVTIVNVEQRTALTPDSSLDDILTSIKNIQTAPQVPQQLQQAGAKNVKDIPAMPATVRATPNNEESSRSQLFIVFSVQNEEAKSTFTVVDMAGVENPVDLVSTFWTGAVDMAFTKLHPETKINDTAFKTDSAFFVTRRASIPDPRSYAVQLVDEGFYINESINHMLVYLNSICHAGPLESCPKTIPLNAEWKDYSTDMCIMNPPFASKPSGDRKGNDQLFIIPVMQFLQGQYPKSEQSPPAPKNKFPPAPNNKPSKMIMFVMLRTNSSESTSHGAVRATLQYAERARCHETPRARAEQAKKKEEEEQRARQSRQRKPAK